VKNLLLIALIVLTGKTRLEAQANTNVSLQLPGTEMKLTAQTGDFYLHTQRAIHHGHVRVTDPKMKLTCEWLTADMSPGSGRVDHIVCDTNVVIDFVDDRGQTNHAVCGRAVYFYQVVSGVTNETITLTEHPEVDTTDAQTMADVIIWDRVSDHVHYDNEIILPRRHLVVLPEGTNSTAVKTNNLPPQHLGSLPVGTNSPATNAAPVAPH
jgi:lipopolysaccharide export system protein LptA